MPASLGWLAAAVAIALFGVQVTQMFGRIPVVWPDEALFAESARLLLIEGRLATDLLAGAATGVSERMYWFPPGYPLLLAAGFSLAGGTVETMRAISVLGALGLLGATYGLARRYGSAPAVAAGAVALLALDPVFVRAALIGRPDIIALALVVVSLLLGSGSRAAFAAGLCAGGAALTHPYGGIAAVILLARIAVARRRSSLFALAGLAAPVTPWLLYILQDVPSFIDQLRLTTARHGLPWSLERLVLGILDQYGEAWAVVMPVAWMLGGIGLVLLVHRSRTAMPLLGAFVLLSLTTLSLQMWHPLYPLPLMYLGIAKVLAWLPRLHTLTILVTTASVAGIIVSDVGQLAYRTHIAAGARPAAYAEWTAEIARSLPAGSRVLTGGVPDPTVGLFDRGLTLVALQDEARSYARYRARLGAEIDYVVFTGSLPAGMTDLIRGRVTLERIVRTARIDSAHRPYPCRDWMPCGPYEAAIYRVTVPAPP